MARNKRGRKVKHVKKIYKRRKTAKQKIFSFVLFLIIVASLVFLGYSIGKPLREYLMNRGNGTADSSSGWTPTVTTNESTDSSESSEPETPEPTGINYTAIRLSVDALASEDSLAAALADAKSLGYSAVVVTLKADGGVFYFSTANAYVQGTDAAAGILSANQIASLIKNEGLIPIAEISVLKDHIITRSNKELGYIFTDGESMWIDNKATKGGKSWMSPFSEKAVQFNSDLTGEITLAGFDRVIAYDMIFPPFRNSDLGHIGDTVKDANRHTALTSLASVIKAKVGESGGDTFVKIKASEALKGTAEIFYPDELAGINFVVSLDFENLNTDITLKNSSVLSIKDKTIAEKTTTILQKLESLSTPSKIIPIINKASLSTEDFDTVINTLTGLGYKTYIIE